MFILSLLSAPGRTHSALPFRLTGTTKLVPVLLGLLLLLLAGNRSVTAQKVDHRKTYESAKTELKNKNFDKAMELFKKATVEHHENINKINAHYFYAYCALKLKQYWSANHYLQKIIDKYPTWNKISEVYYLQAAMAFEKREYTNAIQWTQRIQSKFMKNDVDNMKWNFLNYPSLKDTLIEINKKFSNDTTTATILYYLIKDDSGWKNKKMVKRLTEDYAINTEPEKKTPPVLAAQAPKDSLRIAVVMPFNLNENIKDGEIKSNMYLFALYNGIRFAADSMKKAGAKIRLVVYDYGKDSADFMSFIEKPELAGYDIMIGPLQNSLGPRVNRFAREKNVMVINPLSTNLKFTEGSDKVFLFRTSPETQAKQGALFAAKQFYPKKALIISSKNPKDSVAANVFKTAYDSAGGKVTGRQSLTAGTLGKMDNLFSKKNTDSAGVIFVSTKDQFIGVSVVRKLTELDKKTPLLVPAEWIDFQSMNFDQMKKQNLYFMGSDYIYNDSDTIRRITRSLRNRTHFVPTIYTYTGYEIIYQLAQLARYDQAFFNQPDLRLIKPQPGFLLSGIDYRNSKDNNLFMIQRFTDAGFVNVK